MTKRISLIKDTINNHQQLLKNKYFVNRIAVFGSTARGEETEKSDVDILVELSKPMGFLKFLELEEFLSKIIGKKVDLVTKKALKEAIKKEILREAIYV